MDWEPKGTEALLRCTWRMQAWIKPRERLSWSWINEFLCEFSQRNLIKKSSHQSSLITASKNVIFRWWNHCLNKAQITISRNLHDSRKGCDKWTERMSSPTGQIEKSNNSKGIKALCFLLTNAIAEKYDRETTNKCRIFARGSPAQCHGITAGKHSLNELKVNRQFQGDLFD